MVEDMPPGVDTVTDAELIKQYLSGQTDAFEMLYHRYRKQVYAYLNGMLPGQMATVDDLFQKSWLKVIDKLPSYRDEGRFIAYILRIARNQALDWLRSQKNVVCLADGDGMAKTELPSPDREYENHEIGKAIAGAVVKLPAEQREVFLLRQQDVPFKEIAAIQAVSVNTVLGRMRYAVENLRRVLLRSGVQV